MSGEFYPQSNEWNLWFKGKKFKAILQYCLRMRHQVKAYNHWAKSSNFYTSDNKIKFAKIVLNSKKSFDNFERVELFFRQTSQQWIIQSQIRKKYNSVLINKSII